MPQTPTCLTFNCHIDAAVHDQVLPELLGWRWNDFTSGMILLWLMSGFTVQGSLVRAVRRIEEVLRQLSSAAEVIGEVDLVHLFEQCRDKIKRDIIFAASLYL